MCGISGFYSKTLPSINNPIFKMNSAISHRGPDSNNVWLDKNSGIERWSQPALRGWYLTGPAVAGSHLALGDQEGNLHWLNKDTGELVSREEFDSSGFFVEPVVADDKLILYTRDGEVSVVNTPN